MCTLANLDFTLKDWRELSLCCPPAPPAVKELRDTRTFGLEPFHTPPFPQRAVQRWRREPQEVSSLYCTWTPKKGVVRVVVADDGSCHLRTGAGGGSLRLWGESRAARKGCEGRWFQRGLSGHLEHGRRRAFGAAMALEDPQQESCLAVRKKRECNRGCLKKLN